MKKLKPIMIVAVMVLAASTMLRPAFAEENKENPAAMKSYKGSAEFERIKSLTGTWEGVMQNGERKMPMTVEYRVVAGGSAVEERTFAGTPMEMVTIYHDEKGKVAMTHYCMLHNRPHLRLTKSDEKSISFELDEKNPGIEDPNEDHMHALTLTFESEDEIVQDWKHYAGGKDTGMSNPMTLRRVKG